MMIGRKRYHIAVKNGWYRRGGRVNFMWWANHKNFMRMRAQYIRKVRVTAARNMAIARKQGWFRFVKVNHMTWGNAKTFGRLRAIGMRNVKLQKSRQA